MTGNVASRHHNYANIYFFFGALMFMQSRVCAMTSVTDRGQTGDLTNNMNSKATTSNSVSLSSPMTSPVPSECFASVWNNIRNKQLIDRINNHSRKTHEPKIMVNRSGRHIDANNTEVTSSTVYTTTTSTTTTTTTTIPISTSSMKSGSRSNKGDRPRLLQASLSSRRLIRNSAYNRRRNRTHPPEDALRSQQMTPRLSSRRSIPRSVPLDLHAAPSVHSEVTLNHVFPFPPTNDLHSSSGKKISGGHGVLPPSLSRTWMNKNRKGRKLTLDPLPRMPHGVEVSIPSEKQSHFAKADPKEGTYRFGYDTGTTGEQSYRYERRHLDGKITGKYGYIDPEGVLREVNYIADENGYRPTLINRYRVDMGYYPFVGPIPSQFRTS